MYFIFKKYIKLLTLSICLLLPQIGHSSNSFKNFLPMEDAMSTSRNVEAFDNVDIKPFRQTVDFKKQPTEGINLASVDIYAFVLLAIVFFIISKRNSKTRKINL